MAKAILLLSAVCILAFVNFAQCHDSQAINVEGSVYCDTCRVQFQTKLSEYIEGATVRLACKDIETEKETYSVEGVTDKNGKYIIKVEGDHENELCEVSIVKSPREDCKESAIGFENSRVVCSANVGIHNPTRYANPLFFMKTEAVSGCKDVLDELGLFPLEFN
ncbi:anther-specific protein LAT52-like [Nicotiana tabacum]|uniref:Anther-specific protein LAT52-like n=1 Tax=Nicotiana tabacum TaxID=4097 RepID=A0A1S3X8K0_TOBAC|nr:anther-specific protein LAT52-like [Nicotiana tomentosiformis]XP_016436073.1 PREDICTED: anther-specific protein LAT52-like [Nicotiana tabacum]